MYTLRIITEQLDHSSICKNCSINCRQRLIDGYKHPPKKCKAIDFYNELLYTIHSKPFITYTYDPNYVYNGRPTNKKDIYTEEDNIHE
jgi:hypothetical protein